MTDEQPQKKTPPAATYMYFMVGQREILGVLDAENYELFENGNAFTLQNATKLQFVRTDKGPVPQLVPFDLLDGGMDLTLVNYDGFYPAGPGATKLHQLTMEEIREAQSGLILPKKGPLSL